MPQCCICETDGGRRNELIVEEIAPTSSPSQASGQQYCTHDNDGLHCNIKTPSKGISWPTIFVNLYHLTSSAEVDDF
ncbi:hypothetical protein TNCV_2404171 [Trichonephila clavipes]|nr:hypothetical protein TNCV_2404171 [Trichonephila clavipes]